MICPKCNCILSDKTLVCVKCGYVLNYAQPDSKDLYDMVLKRINEGGDAILSNIALRKYGVSKEHSWLLFETIGNTVLKGIYKGNISYLYDEFLRYGCEMEFIPSKDEYVNSANSVIENRLRAKGESIAYKKKNMKCPRCTSSNLRIDTILPLLNKGYKWRHFCRNCGYVWKVK